MAPFIKNVIEYIKSVFTFLNKQQNQINERPLEYYIPKLDRKKSLKLFEEVEVGDIIYAPTSYENEMLEKLGISHRQRPYLVLKKEFNYLVGFCGTSKIKKKQKLPFYIENGTYNIKGGVVELARLHNINNTTILSIADHLYIRDMLKINQIIFASNLMCKTMFNLELELKPGMVVATPSNLLYFVYKNEGSCITMYHFQEEQTSIEYFFCGKKYYIDADNPLNSEKFDYVILSSNETRIVKEIDKIVNKKKKKVLYSSAKELPKENVETSSKKSERFKNSHFFKFDIGQVFVMGDRTFVYLFSSGFEDYAIEIYEDESISPLTRIEHYKDYLREDGRLEDSEIIDVVEETSERNHKCQWLYDVVKKQYGLNDDRENKN